MSSIVTRIEPERRLRIPDEWGDEFSPDHAVELVRCAGEFSSSHCPKRPCKWLWSESCR